MISRLPSRVLGDGDGKRLRTIDPGEGEREISQRGIDPRRVHDVRADDDGDRDQRILGIRIRDVNLIRGDPTFVER